MCSICKEALPDFTIPHDELRCPLRNSRYCSNCAKYGHLTKKCPDRPSVIFREPVYLEQLINPTDLKQFSITSVTPILPYNVEEEKQILEIKDDDTVIRAYLAARGIRTTKKSRKRHILEEYAAVNNKRVVYV